MTLHPSIAAVRLPVRRTLARPEPRGGGRETVAVACSGGADSLALASAAVFEGHKLGMRVVGVTVDHGLQPGSAEQADRVVAQLALASLEDGRRGEGQRVGAAAAGDSDGPVAVEA